MARFAPFERMAVQHLSFARFLPRVKCWARLGAPMAPSCFPYGGIVSTRFSQPVGHLSCILRSTPRTRLIFTEYRHCPITASSLLHTCEATHVGRSSSMAKNELLSLQIVKSLT